MLIRKYVIIHIIVFYYNFFASIDLLQLSLQFSFYNYFIVIAQVLLLLSYCCYSLLVVAASAVVATAVVAIVASGFLIELF